MGGFVKAYLCLSKVYLFLFIIGVSLLLVYIQQEYVYIPHIDDVFLFNDVFKMQLLDQFNRYLWISFFMAPLIVFMRIILVSGCLFVGGFVF